MKKKIFYLTILFIIPFHLFAYTYNPEFKADGLFSNLTVDYGKTFNENIKIINVELFFSPYPSRPATFNQGLSALFSPDKLIFDLYYTIGITYYPFQKIFSLTGTIGIGGSIYALLNHFPYMASAQANIDIPIYKNNNVLVHNLTFGAGVQHRNAAKIIGYIKSDNYYGIYNSYFFEIGYRITMNGKQKK